MLFHASAPYSRADSKIRFVPVPDVMSDLFYLATLNRLAHNDYEYAGRYIEDIDFSNASRIYLDSMNISELRLKLPHHSLANDMNLLRLIGQKEIVRNVIVLKHRNCKNKTYELSNLPTLTLFQLCEVKVRPFTQISSITPWLMKKLPNIEPGANRVLSFG